MLSPTCAGYIAPVQPRSRLHHISLLQARLVTGHAAGGRRVICSSTPGESYSHCITRSDLGNQRGSRHRGLNRQLQVDTSHRCCYADQKTSSATAEDDPLAEADEDGKARAKLRKQAPSSWTAKHAGADADTQSDFLSNLGEGQDYNINVDHGKSCHPVTNSIIMQSLSAAGSGCHLVRIAIQANLNLIFWLAQVRTSHRLILFLLGTFWGRKVTLLMEAYEIGTSENLTTWWETIGLHPPFLTTWG